MLKFAAFNVSDCIFLSVVIRSPAHARMKCMRQNSSLWRGSRWRRASGCDGAQEADLQRHSRRLVRDGKIQDVAGRRLGGKVSTASHPDSSRHFEVFPYPPTPPPPPLLPLPPPAGHPTPAAERSPCLQACTQRNSGLRSWALLYMWVHGGCLQVLAEILQQKARVHDPHAASRQEFVRWVCQPRPLFRSGLPAAPSRAFETAPRIQPRPLNVLASAALHCLCCCEKASRGCTAG